MIVTRTALAVVLSLGLLAAPLTAAAQQAEKIARVGVLLFGPVPSPEEVAKWRLSPLRLSPAMREVGWVEGRNLVIERRYGESTDQLHASAAELVRLKVDVLLVPGAGLARIAQGETRTIPIVIATSGLDLATAGLVASLARPGGNITGLQILGADLIGKRLELLKELLPNLTRIATLWEPITTMEVDPTARNSYSVAADVAARTLGIKHDSFGVERPEDFPAVFRSMNKKGDQGLLLFTSPFMWAHLKQIVDLAATHRIPLIYEEKSWVEAGGLMSYGASYSDIMRRAAAYIDKILKGAKPADLPVQQPTKFELIINLKTAKALGLTIPRSLLSVADEVIQ
jgi:putative tryptophan/tyrosine transport system substrate-binding protein